MGQVGKSKLDRLKDAGCIPDEASFDESAEEWIEKSMSDAEIDTIIEIKSKLGSDFFIQDDKDLRHWIFF